MDVSIQEDSKIGTILATFNARDADRGGRSRVSYRIDRSSDRKRQFSVNPQGVVKLQRMLDREETPRHQIKILAIDDGVPAKSSTGILSLTVSDTNDNAPQFLVSF